MRPPRQRRERPPRSQPPAEEGAAGADANAGAGAGTPEGQATRAPRPPRERRERAPRPPREEAADQSSGLQVLVLQLSSPPSPCAGGYAHVFW